MRSRRTWAIAWTWALPAEALARRGTHSEAGTVTVVTVANFVHYWAVHDQNHTRKLAKMFNEGV